jgi:hypothetical protein
MGGDVQRRQLQVVHQRQPDEPGDRGPPVDVSSEGLDPVADPLAEQLGTHLLESLG